jgi:toxin HigB-1
MIASFGDPATEDLYNEAATSRALRFPPSVARRARRKMDMLDAASQLVDLRAPPGNRLEALHGDFLGCYSIRVNDQWRIVFRWEEGAAWDVRLLDYH